MDEDIIKVLKLPTKPSLLDILPLAKARNITSPTDLWNLFDRITKLWSESHNYWEGASDD